jgi:ABC-type uncharacterized transport system substrate-binding protein
LKRWLSRSFAIPRHIAWLGWVCACLTLLPGQAGAAVAVVLSEESAAYQEAYQAIRTFLGDTAQALVRLKAGELTPSSMDGVSLAVAVGVHAAEALAALPGRTPVLVVMVPRAWYARTGHTRLSEGGRRSVSVIYLDQSFQQQAKLIRLAIPGARRVGVLLGSGQGDLVDELKEALRANQLSLTHDILDSDARLVPAMEGVLSGSDVLMALPDAQVFNRNTAQSLFLTTYRYRTPVLGYSQSMTRAGALLSLHSSPAQIGRQAAETITRSIRGGPVRLPPPAHPTYFSISANAQVAHSLGYPLIAETELEKRLGMARP